MTTLQRAMLMAKVVVWRQHAANDDPLSPIWDAIEDAEAVLAGRHAAPDIVVPVLLNLDSEGRRV